MGGDKDYSFTIGSASEDIGGWDSGVTIDDITYCIPDQNTYNTTTITLDNSFVNDTGSEYTYNMSGIDSSEDPWPPSYRVKEMIEKYPALKIQYEKFLAIYNLIKDDHKDDLDDILK